MAMLDDPELLVQLADKPSWIPLVLSIIAEINQQVIFVQLKLDQSFAFHQ